MTVGNYSRNPQAALADAVQKGYTRVRFQQGKPILDRELNLASDLAAPNRVLKHYVGSGVPEGSDGFHLGSPDPNAHDFTIKAGRCVVGGLEVVLNADTTYKNQPHKENVRPFPTGVYYVCLRAFTVEVNETQDADLKNAADIGFETALRERVDWEVLVYPNFEPPPDLFILGILYFYPGETQPPPETEIQAQIVKALAENPPVQALAEKTFAESAVRKAGGGQKNADTVIFAPSGESTPVPEEPQTGLYDLRVREVTLSKVRGDLDIIMNPEHTRLAEQSVRVRNFSARVLNESSVTVNAGQSSTVVLARESYLGINPYLLVSVWGTGTFTWSERSNNGDRVLVVTNTAQLGQATVHVKALLLDA